MIDRAGGAAIVLLLTTFVSACSSLNDVEPVESVTAEMITVQLASDLVFLTINVVPNASRAGRRPVDLRCQRASWSSLSTSSR